MTLNLANMKCVCVCVCVCVCPHLWWAFAIFQLPTTFLSSLARSTSFPLKEEKPPFLIHNDDSLQESKHPTLALLIRASHSGTWQSQSHGHLGDNWRENLDLSFQRTWSCEDARVELLQLSCHHRRFEWMQRKQTLDTEREIWVLQHCWDPWITLHPKSALTP